MSRRTTTRLTVRAVAALLLLAVLPALPASAAPTWLLPSTFIDDRYAAYPESAVSASGEAVVVYLATVDGQQVVLATSRSPGSGWSSRTVISNPSVGATEPHVVIDGAGNATAVWRTLATGTPIQASFRPAGGTWGVPTYLSVPSANATGPAAAVDAAGTVTVVWTHVEGMGTSYIESASRPAGGVWSAPETRSTGYADRPTVAAGPAGVAAAAWVVHDAGQSHVMGTVKDGSAWATPVPLSSPSSFTADVTSAVDGTGRATVAWSHSDGTYLVVQAAERAAGGPWSAPLDLSAGGSDAFGTQLAANSAEGAVIGWHRVDGANYRAQVTHRPPGGGWEAPVTLSAPDQDGFLRDVGIDPAGGLVAVWSRNNGTVPVTQASRRPAGGEWSAAENLGPGATESGASGISVDGAGDVIVPLTIFTIPSRVEVTALDAAGPLVTGLSVPATGTSGVGLTFAATASDTWTGVASYAWSFGDGTAATGASTSHAYAAPGTYPVTLTVTDAVGNATTRTASTRVAAPVPAITTFKLKKKRIATDEKTKLKVRLTTASTLKLVVKSQHKHVVKGKKKYVKVVLKKRLPAGLSKITIKAKFNGKTLSPDTYVLTGRATNSSGTSPKKKAQLRVVRP